MKAVLALDQGTTSSRALLFDRQANILAVAQQEFTQHYPHQAGWSMTRTRSGKPS